VTKDTLLEYETNCFSDIHCAVDKYKINVEILVKRDQLKRKMTKDTLLEYETNYFSDIHCAVDKY
jgi:hypothetical protein